MNLELSYFKMDGEEIEIVDKKCREQIAQVATPEVIEGINNRLDAIDGEIENLAPVATSGNYNDLTNKPNLAPVATSGSYNDLTNKPTIPVVPTLAPVATSGNYNDLTNKPNLATVATSGSYNDLTNKPTIPVVPTLAPVATSGNYSDLTNKPTIPTNTNQLINGAGFITTSEREAIISNPFILTKIPTTDGVKFKVDASFTYQLNLNVAYGSGFLADFTIPIPSDVRPTIAFYDVQLTACATGQIVVCAMSSVTKSEVNGWVWSPISMQNDITIHFSAYGF